MKLDDYIDIKAGVSATLGIAFVIIVIIKLIPYIKFLIVNNVL